jgi:putative FmdB family regulatory protein
MPIYEYECLNCGYIQEAFQKFSDKPLTTCSKCGENLKKIISNSSFVLKGTGWYKTDYASMPAVSEKKSNGTKNADSDLKPDTKIESKPEATAKA